MTTSILPGTVPWPEDFQRRYREEGYWADRTIASYIVEAAGKAPDACALVSGTTRLSYRELVDQMDAGAENLLALGLKAGDRVLVQLPNNWQFVVLTLACFRVGIIPVMTLPAHRRHELLYLAELSQATAIASADVIRDFDHRELAEEIASLMPSVQHVLISGATGDLDELLIDYHPDSTRAARLDAIAPHPDSPACFLLSGGTTGLSKLIVRTHNDYAYNVLATSRATGISSDSVYLGTLPASHNFPLACPGVLGALFFGGKSVMLPSPEPARAFATIAHEGVTVASAVPAVAQRWIDYAKENGSAQLESLEVLQVGGSRLADELAVRVRPDLGCTLQQVFGMAEGLINMTRLDDPDEIICTTQGRPVSPADEVRIVDADGNDLPDGEPGLILTRGPYTPRGYYLAEAHNTRAFTPEGWYSSGDIVVRRPDGYLVVHGREKDMINRGGEKISAEEIENLLYRIEAIDLAAAVSMPDATLGERLCIYVTLRPDASLTLEYVRETFAEIGIAAYKMPEKLVVVESLPLTKVGKIDKKALRDDVIGRL
ncbi:(2,3-dihydroxybenzoyl)adenylate synthase [Subtercola frigoramans]|uniref:2,3-dihydroxybenzoate-AMP ligase n=2 Tax=Subtercola frigoramans TaxID=120298 RepID=A0ABS2L9C0_9MICO|nr:AMP-binding protein [Subtercola frigoramans]MBM7473698.1 2,3-dihydroxybenzoate-AMP ligase [Subtercola frigoramans]